MYQDPRTFDKELPLSNGRGGAVKGRARPRLRPRASWRLVGVAGSSLHQSIYFQAIAYRRKRLLLNRPGPMGYLKYCKL